MDGFIYLTDPRDLNILRKSQLQAYFDHLISKRNKKKLSM